MMLSTQQPSAVENQRSDDDWDKNSRASLLSAAGDKQHQQKQQQQQQQQHNRHIATKATKHVKPAAQVLDSIVDEDELTNTDMGYLDIASSPSNGETGTSRASATEYLVKFRPPTQRAPPHHVAVPQLAFVKR